MSSSNGFFESINPWSWGAKTRASGTDDTFSDAAKLYPDLWGELFTGSNVICCPISGSLADSMTKDLLMSHILIPQRVGGEFKTILGEHVYMSGNQLLCGAGFLEQREVNIISVDEITDSSGKVATMLRINRPLVGGIVALDDAEEISLRAMFKYMAVLRSFPEAESSFIVLDDYIKEINYVGSKSVDGFSRIQPSLAVSLQLQWERATEKLCRINALVSALGGGFDNTKRMIGQILESYLMYAVSGTVYPWMCSLLALDDKRLYEYLETLQHYTQSDLGIPPALQCCQIEAVTELRTLRCAETPVDKLLVLKRAVKFIRTRIDRNVKSKFPQDDVELATDDIVLLIIWCLLQLHLSESLINPESVLQAMNGGGNVGKEIIRTFLVSELEFMSKYHFNGSSKSELGFTLCHFQVAVDWIITRSQAFAQRKRIRSIRSPEMINLSSVVQDLKIDMSAAAKPTVDQALKIDLSSIANSIVVEDSKIDLSGAANPNIDEDLSIDLSAATNPIVDEDSKIDQSAIAKLSFDSDMQADVPVVSKSGKVTDRINNIEKKEFMRVGDRFNPGSPVSHPGSCPASSVPSRPVESRYVNLRKVIEKKAEQAKEKDSLTGPNIVEKDKSVRGSIGEKEKNMRGIARDNGMKGIFRDNSMKGIVRDNSQKAMIEKKSNIVKDNDIIDALQGSLEVVGEKKEETLEMQKLGLEYLHGLCVTATEMNLDWITRINKNQRAVRQKAVGSVEYKMPYSFTAFSSPCVSTSSMKSVIDDESLKVNTENDLNVNLNFCFSSTSENNKVAKGFEKKGRVLLILGDDHTHHPEILKKKITIISDRTNKPGEILSVSGAVGVFAAVNSDGRVFTWGIPDSGRLGRGTYVRDVTCLQMIIILALHSKKVRFEFPCMLCCLSLSPCFVGIYFNTGYVCTAQLWCIT